MCTAILNLDPFARVPVLLAGIRDEFTGRPWEGPARHWPDRPALIGGRDLRAGGTWLAVDPGTDGAGPRAATVLNGQGRDAPQEGRLSRGELPLLGASGGDPGALDLERYDPFLLLTADLRGATLWVWDGRSLSDRTLAPGLHIVVNTGLEGAGAGSEGEPAGAAAESAIRARLAHFRPRFAGAPRPEPRPGVEPGTAWGEWLSLAQGDGLDRTDPRTLLPIVELPDGREWGTGSVSLVALGRDGVRYDFSGRPGDPDGWTEISASGTAA